MRKPKHRLPDTMQNRLLFNPDDCGRTQFSKAAGKFMRPANTRRIDPASPEGRAIATKYTAS